MKCVVHTDALQGVPSCKPRRCAIGRAIRGVAIDAAKLAGPREVTRAAQSPPSHSATQAAAHSPTHSLAQNGVFDAHSTSARSGWHRCDGVGGAGVTARPGRCNKARRWRHRRGCQQRGRLQRAPRDFIPQTSQLVQSESERLVRTALEITTTRVGSRQVAPSRAACPETAFGPYLGNSRGWRKV